MQRPYVIVQVFVSLDGYITNPLSSLPLPVPHDFFESELVEKIRASCDAVLVGSETLRREDPSLALSLSYYHDARIRQGRSCEPVRITLTSSGDLPPGLKFFKEGLASKIVYHSNSCSQTSLEGIKEICSLVAVDEEHVSPRFVASHLFLCGVQRLLIEGGSRTVAGFLKEGLVDEMRLIVVPVFLGEQNETRLFETSLDANNGHCRNQMRLCRIDKIGNSAMAQFKPRSE